MRRLLFAITFAASTIGFFGLAQALVLNNGIVVVTNHTPDVIEIYLEHQFAVGHFIEKKVPIGPGQTWHSSACCFAAGSPYQMRVVRKGPASRNLPDHKFVPHLCNRNGIPYGFYEVTVGNNNYYYAGDDRTCYEGPL